MWVHNELIKGAAWLLSDVVVVRMCYLQDKICMLM